MGGLRFVLPPALGRAKAEARAELIRAALEQKLGEPVETYVAANYADIEERTASGEAHLVWAPVGVTAKLPAARAVFTIVRGGQTNYRSAIVARKNAGVRLAALAGTKAAWVDPLSAGGYLLAIAKLRAEGIEPGKTFASQVFLGSHRAAVEAVLHETADVTAVSSQKTDAASMAEKLRWYAGPAGDKLTAIAFTESCLNDAIVLPASLSEAKAIALAQKLVPTTPSEIARSRLLAALEAEGLVQTPLEAYHRLAPLLTPPPAEDRITLVPPSRSSRPSWH
ncbi:PhnD/SsuA/transferrin family substrate-binding protein [Polyangium sp. 6x1]|uniref:phosphate/phosphite/phosphonate ABC transporter substrate-binding protein n=1 Tax=Polyangium sp. 6x1 TaxID=3042689 RepID=UPI0024830BBA|nr:PhnD/SsuA/transferrin family substrate-binding protein [Polyangium sp. 6x1]MDI1450197.1 PhnD/SsuA/transferrin family substrate-binding protein [Polyangium sp. 6x1]